MTGPPRAGTLQIPPGRTREVDAAVIGPPDPGRRVDAVERDGGPASQVLSEDRAVPDEQEWVPSGENAGLVALPCQERVRTRGRRSRGGTTPAGRRGTRRRRGRFRRGSGPSTGTGCCGAPGRSRSARARWRLARFDSVRPAPTPVAMPTTRSPATTATGHLTTRPRASKRGTRPGRSSAWAKSPAVANRSAGSLASALWIDASTWAGTDGRRRRSRLGSSVTILAMTAWAEGPSWGGSPASIS